MRSRGIICITHFDLRFCLTGIWMPWNPNDNNYFYCYYHYCLTRKCQEKFCVLTGGFNLGKREEEGRKQTLRIRKNWRGRLNQRSKPLEARHVTRSWRELKWRTAECVVVSLLFFMSSSRSLLTKARPRGSLCHILDCSRLICGDLRLKKRSIIRLPFKVTPPYHIDRQDDLSAASRPVVFQTRPLPLWPSSAGPERSDRISLGEVLYCCNSPHWFCSPLTAAAVNRLEFNERESRWNMTAGSPENIHKTRRMNHVRVLMSGYDAIRYQRTELLRQFIKSLQPKRRRPAPQLILHFASD